MLISIADAAKILGISRSTAYRLAQEGRLPCVRSLGPVRVHEGMLRKQIEEEAQNNLRDGGEGSVDRKIAPQKQTTRTPAQLDRELDRLLTIKPARNGGGR